MIVPEYILFMFLSLAVTSYDPNSCFTTSALSRMEGVGIPVHDFKLTWQNILLVVRHLKLDNLAQKMESYLSGVTDQALPHAELHGFSMTLYNNICMIR